MPNNLTDEEKELDDWGLLALFRSETYHLTFLSKQAYKFLLNNNLPATQERTEKVLARYLIGFEKFCECLERADLLYLATHPIYTDLVLSFAK